MGGLLVGHQGLILGIDQFDNGLDALAICMGHQIKVGPGRFCGIMGESDPRIGYPDPVDPIDNPLRDAIGQPVPLMTKSQQFFS